MTIARKIVHVAPNGRVDERNDDDEQPFLARTRNPAQRRRFATAEEAINYMRVLSQADSEPCTLAVMADIMDEMERVIAAERSGGTRPDDGTKAGRIMAREIKLLQYQRGQLANARREAASWYDPLTSR